MSQHEDTHGHDDEAVHVHIHSWKLYLAILLILLTLTIVTVAASYLDIDGIMALGGEVQGVGAWNLTVAVLIATVKASIVVLFFMHLKDDSRFNALVFVGSLLFIGVFFAYTMNDTAVRGTMDRYNGVHVDPDNGMSAPGGIEEGGISGELHRDRPAPAEEHEEAAAPGHAPAHAEPEPAAEPVVEPPAEALPADAAAAADAGALPEGVPAEGEAAPEEAAPPAEAEPAPAEPAPEAEAPRVRRPRAEPAAEGVPTPRARVQPAVEQPAPPAAPRRPRATTPEPAAPSP